MSDRLAVALADRYRIQRELGAGGMATVYLADDIKHDRKVAIKVLRPELAAVIGADRFLAEIKTTANLQHPHILSLFDSGTVDGTVFYVMPFVDGESLRDKLTREKQLPVDESLRISREVADALQYAHDHGIIHRDIKPENILLHGGHALVADFGIALAAAKTGGTRMTETGMSLGTPQYMSPEQAMGERDLDARTDVYALGVVTYEMLVGEPPFTGPTAQAIVAKVMTADPVDAATLRKSVPANVSGAIRVALQKLPADRFASAREFADALANPAFATIAARPDGGRARTTRWRWALAGAAAALMIMGTAGYTGLLAPLIAGMGGGGASGHETFIQRSFGSEAVFTARFAHDGETIVYSAATEGNTPRMYIIRPDYPVPQPLGDSATHLLAISARDEMAVLVRATYLRHRIFSGTLARMPVGGGAPREILRDVRDADWAPKDSDLAIIHRVGEEDRLEYPVGTVLYRSSGYLSDLRFSPTGDRLAFFEHPSLQDDRGEVAVVDLKGTHHTLSQGYGSLEGLAWSPDGKRILYDGLRGADGAVGIDDQTYAATLGGTVRLVLPIAGSVTIQDVSAAGHWLITRDDDVERLLLKTPERTADLDVSWMDYSSSPIISADGKMLAFTDAGADAGANYRAMMRKTDGSPAVRLGAGAIVALSPDHQWALGQVPSSPAQLMLYPTGAGQARRIDHGEFTAVTSGQFFPDGQGLLICGTQPGHASRCYIGSVAGGLLRSLTPDGTISGAISPDGRTVLSQTVDGSYWTYPVDGTPPRSVPTLKSSDVVWRWSPDGRAVWITRAREEVPANVDQVDLATGQRTPLVANVHPTSTRLINITTISLANDPRAYAYGGDEYLSRIFEVRGLR